MPAITLDILGREWTATDSAKRTLVCELAHYGAETPLGDEHWLGVRLLADGFGRVSLSDEGASEMLGDWSHVRDSSPEAFRSMFAYLAAHGLVS